MELLSRPTVVAQLAEALRRTLRSGEWTTHLPSERELSERFDVSRPTLRRALQLLAEEGAVRAERGIGWHVGRPRSKVARSRQPKAVGILCFVPLDEASLFNLFAIDKLQNHLHNAGLAVHVHAGTQYASQNYRQALDRLIRGTPACDWVLLASGPAIMQWFRERRIRIFLALTPRPLTDVPGIHLDLQAVYRHVFGTLVRLGHRRIALVSPRPVAAADGAASDASRREAEFSYDDALRPYKNLAGFGVRLAVHTRTPEAVENAIRLLYKSPKPPTALFVMRPQHTLTALTYLMKSGTRVPEDVSVIGIGHEPFLDHVRPSLAHYALDRRTYARTLCRMVLSWVRTGYWSHREAELFLQFREGQSLGPAR